jgi:hypothetical protein
MSEPIRQTSRRPRDAPAAEGDVLATAEVVVDLARRALGPESRPQLSEALRRARDGEAHLIVVGQFKRGKTTLVDALVGHDVLPRAATPLTSVVTLVRYGPHPRAVLTLEDGSCREIPPHELADYVTERGNPRNARAVRRADVEVPAPLLREGLVLVDTPGSGSTYRHNTEVARRALARADAALIVLSADPPLSAEELAELGAVRAAVPLALCALNKIDQLDPQERADVIQFTRERLDEAGHGDVPLVPVSAREALEARSSGAAAPAASGIQELEGLIRSRVCDRSRLVGREAVRRRALETLDAVRRAAELERGALQLSAAELEARLRRVERIAGEARRALDEDMALTRVRAERALREEIEPWLAELARATAATLDARLCTSVRDGSAAPADSEHRAEELVQAAVERWLGEAQARVADAVDPILAEAAERANALRAQMLTETAALFELAPPPPRAAALGVRAQTAGLIQVHVPPSGALDLATRSLRRRLPGPIGRRAALAAARSRLADLVDRHAGRLRAAAARAVDDACRQMAQQHALALRDSLAIVERALASAGESNAVAAGARARELGRLDAVLRRVDDLEAALAREGDARARG